MLLCVLALYLTLYFVVCYSTREKVVKCLQSNPVQVSLYVAGSVF